MPSPSIPYRPASCPCVPTAAVPWHFAAARRSRCHQIPQPASYDGVEQVSRVFAHQLADVMLNRIIGDLRNVHEPVAMRQAGFSGPANPTLTTTDVESKWLPAPRAGEI
jgi:hypothetical protein